MCNQHGPDQPRRTRLPFQSIRDSLESCRNFEIASFAQDVISSRSARFKRVSTTRGVCLNERNWLEEADVASRLTRNNHRLGRNPPHLTRLMSPTPHLQVEAAPQLYESVSKFVATTPTAGRSRSQSVRSRPRFGRRYPKCVQKQSRPSRNQCGFGRSSPKFERDNPKHGRDCRRFGRTRKSCGRIRDTSDQDHPEVGETSPELPGLGASANKFHIAVGAR